MIKFPARSSYVSQAFEDLACHGPVNWPVSVTSYAQTKSLETIIAWVNNDIILKSEYDNRLADIRAELTRNAKLQGAQLEQAFNEQSKRALQQMIDETLLLQQAKDRGLSADIEVLKALEKMRQDYKLESQEALEKRSSLKGIRSMR